LPLALSHILSHIKDLSGQSTEKAAKKSRTGSENRRVGSSNLSLATIFQQLTAFSTLQTP